MDFLKIMKLTTTDEALTYSDICVMAVIATYAQYQADKTVELSAPDIHGEFPRLSIRTIKDAVKRLSEHKYIEVIKSKGMKNKYRVLIPIEVSTKKSVSAFTQKKNHDPDVEKYKVLINKF